MVFGRGVKTIAYMPSHITMVAFEDMLERNGYVCSRGVYEKSR